MKRVLSLFLSCVFVLGVCFSTPIVASATDGGNETEPLESNDGFVYVELEENTCQIVGYKKKDVTSISIPQNITIGEDEATTQIEVESVLNTAFADCYNLEYVFFTDTDALWADGSAPEEVIVHTNGCSVDLETPYVESEDGTTIYEKCSCDKYRGKITLVATENATYGDEEQAIKVEQTGKLEKVENSAEGYTLSYLKGENSCGETVPTDAGSYTATLTYQGKTITKPFTIAPKTITEENITLTNPVVTYTGSEQLPEITVKDGETPLTEADYTITYKRQNGDDREETSDLTSVGTIFVEVAGKGNYTGIVTKEYVINKAELIITIEEPQQLYVGNDFNNLNWSSSGLKGTDQIKSISFEDIGDEFSEEGEFALSYESAFIENEAGNDVTKNYNVMCNSVTVNIVVCAHDEIEEGKEATCQNKAVCKTCGEEFGEKEPHNWEFTADGAVITATCQTEECPFKETPVTITLEKNNEISFEYDGKEKVNPVKIVYSEGAEVALGDILTGVSVEYTYDGQSCTVKNAGEKYSASVTLGEQTATLPFVITEKELTDNNVTITGIEDSYVYTDSAIEPSIVVKDGNDILVKDRDYTVEYSNNTEVSTGGNPATVTITFKGNYSGTVERTFEIVAQHVHSWTFDVVEDENGNKISATCESCPDFAEGVTITLEAPEIPDDATSLIYDGSVKEATVTISAENTGITPDVVYTSKTEGVQLVEGKCINAGDYTASITLGEETVSVEFTIEKATATFTVPTANTELTYSGQPQALVTAGTTTGGTMQYKIGETGDWSTEIPTGTDATTYTVQYQFVVDDNHAYTGENATTGICEVTIAPHEHSWTYLGDGSKNTITAKCINCPLENTYVTLTLIMPIPEVLVYNNEAKSVSVYVSDENANVIVPQPIYTYNGEEIDECKNAGDYKATITIGEAKATINFTITKATLEATDIPLVMPENPIYNGGPQSVTIEDSGKISAENITVKYYKVLENGETEPLTSAPINAGTYKVKVDVAGENNYADATELTCDEWQFTIGKAQVDITAPTINNLTYTGSAQVLLATAGSTTFGEIEYSLDEKIWSTTIPTATEKGEYTVYYRVQDTENYDGANGSLKVTIEEHQHDWQYSASGAVITATCQNNGCDIETTTVELVAPENLVYDGTEKSVTVKAPHADLLSEYTVTNMKATDAGKYTAFIKIGNATASLDFEISKAVIVVTKVTAIDRVYDGNLVVSINKTDGIVYTGLIDDDKVGFDLSALTGTLSDANVGSNKTVKVNGSIVLTGEDAKNYDVSTPGVTNVNITPATVTITPDAKTSEQYYGLPALTYKVTGFIGVDTLTKAPTLTTNADIKKTGDYTITAAGAEVSANYVIKYATAPLTITAHKNHIVKDGTWKETVHGTCMVAGKEAGTCTLCGGTITRDSKTDPNNHTLITTVTKFQTCTQNGEALVTCANGCKYSLKTAVPADGKSHNFAKDFTVIASTCVAKGSKYKVCQNPGCKVVSEKTEIAINPDAHKNIVTVNAKDATCETKGYTGDKVCNDCKKTTDPGMEINAKGHTESDWIIDKEPTFTEEGAKHTACTVCKKELKKEVIAKRALEVPKVKIENVSNGIKVSWSQDEDATGYTVYSSTYNAKTKKWSSWKNRGTAAATKSSWTDKTVTEGVTYRYTVRSVNGDRKSAYKATSGLLYVVAPKVTVSITSTGLLAKWNKVSNATSYIVYRAELGADGKWGKWVQLGTTQAEKNTWSDTNTQSGVTYRYTVRAVVGKVKSGYTASSSIIYLAQPVLKIANVSNGIQGKWSPIAGATGYTIYRSEYNSSTKKWSKWLTLGTTGATSKTFTDKTVKSGYKYKYTIRAVNGNLKSTYQASNKLVYLAQPTLKISNVANGIQGKWNQVNGATGYIIYRSELIDGKWTKWVALGTAKATAKTFTDKTVKSGVQYRYTIRAKNGGSKSSYVASNQSVFLSVPTVKISSGITGVNVSWSKIEGATSYLVYRREYGNGKWSKWSEIKTVKETSFVDETAKSGTGYRYTVRALKGSSKSTYTSTKTLNYLAAPTVKLEKLSDSIKVNWTQVTGVTGYTIHRAELGADGKWSKWVTLGTATDKYSSCRDKTAKTGVTYKYTVRAVNGKVKSAYIDGTQITNQ